MTWHGYCEFCGEAVSDADGRTAVRGVKGWEPLRAQGGANHIIGREAIADTVAHKTCAMEEYDRRRRGVGPGQGHLL